MSAQDSPTCWCDRSYLAGCRGDVRWDRERSDGAVCGGLRGPGQAGCALVEGAHTGAGLFCAACPHVRDTLLLLVLTVQTTSSFHRESAFRRACPATPRARRTPSCTPQRRRRSPTGCGLRLLTGRGPGRAQLLGARLRLEPGQSLSPATRLRRRHSLRRPRGSRRAGGGRAPLRSLASIQSL